MPHARQQPKHIHPANRGITCRLAHVCDVHRLVVYMEHRPTKIQAELPRAICHPAPGTAIRPAVAHIRVIVIIKIKNPPYGGFCFI